MNLAMFALIHLCVSINNKVSASLLIHIMALVTLALQQSSYVNSG